jgi:pyruvate/2-oxoacid:ferredoxin oxidoreductase beta subunit
VSGFRLNESGLLDAGSLLHSVPEISVSPLAGEAAPTEELAVAFAELYQESSQVCVWLHQATEELGQVASTVVTAVDDYDREQAQWISGGD